VADTYQIKQPFDLADIFAHQFNGNPMFSVTMGGPSKNPDSKEPLGKHTFLFRHFATHCRAHYTLG
jgi:hypothetical protein